MKFLHSNLYIDKPTPHIIPLPVPLSVLSLPLSPLPERIPRVGLDLVLLGQIERIQLVGLGLVLLDQLLPLLTL